MDLKNNKITVGEILNYPPAKAVFQRRFPTALKHPMLGAAKSLTLEQVIGFAKGQVSQKDIQETLIELQKV
jgi:hypothetical protein